MGRALVLVDQVPQVPDSVNQKGHSTFEYEGCADTSGATKAVSVRRWSLFFNPRYESGRIADGNHAPSDVTGTRRSGCGSNRGRMQLVDGLNGHDRALSREGCSLEVSHTLQD